MSMDAQSDTLKATGFIMMADGSLLPPHDVGMVQGLVEQLNQAVSRLADAQIEVEYDTIDAADIGQKSCNLLVAKISQVY